MKIETLINLTNGELLNSPYISEVTSFTDNVDEVRRGSCFFVKEKEDIKKAVDNGAYAIVSTEYENIIDKEIAWIKCDDINKAIISIFKYENLNNKVYICDDITREIIEKMNLDKNLVVLKTYEDLLFSLNFPKKILLSSNSDIFNLFSKQENLKTKEINLSQITIFKSKYLDNEINLPYVYKDNFAKAVNFFETNNLKFSFEFELDRFKPIFVDYKFRKVGYGESEKVLITGIKNDRYFFDELNYLIENTKHAKTVIINEYNKNILNESFNFAMCVDCEVELGEYDETKLFEN